MLYKPEYLDRDSLDGYISAIEGGIRESEVVRTISEKDASGDVKALGFSAKSGKSVGTENTVNFEDHYFSKFKRFLDACNQNPESTGWVKVIEPDTAFPGIGYGAFVEWECEIYLPEFSSILANKEELSNTLQLMSDLQPIASTLGLDVNGLPDSKQLNAMSNFIDKMDIAPVIIGDSEGTDWKVTGVLHKKWIAPNPELDGPYRIVGKVRKTISQGKWYPLFSLPGMNSLDRKSRREMERRSPKNPSENDQFIAGPAIILDVLAIYR